MYRIVLQVSIFLIASFVCVGQKHQMFPLDVLNSPIQHANWFDSNLELVYIENFARDTSAQIVNFENGYAQHRFANQHDFKRSMIGLLPVSIDIVYSKYPFSKEDWQTNYYELLANRLKELFKHYSALNSSEISWRLVMQTGCSSGEEATQLFHGIVIHYQLEMLTAMPIRGFNFSIPQINVDLPKPKLTQQVPPSINEKELIAILYPQSVINREMKQHIPERTKTRDEPGCSTFTTRADKPKSSLWAWLFRR